MFLFRNSWQTPGPGVEKDEPVKKGPARYFEVLLRDAGTLWKAGALFCLCCVPVSYTHLDVYKRQCRAGSRQMR